MNFSQNDTYSCYTFPEYRGYENSDYNFVTSILGKNGLFKTEQEAIDAVNKLQIDCVIYLPNENRKYYEVGVRIDYYLAVRAKKSHKWKVVAKERGTCYADGEDNLSKNKYYFDDYSLCRVFSDVEYRELANKGKIEG